MGYTVYDQVEPDLLHTMVCQIDFLSDTKDGSLIGQGTGILKIA